MIVKSILFDFNGVLIDDEPIQMRAYQEILAEHGIALTEADYMASLGMDDDTFIRTAFERVGQTADANKVLEISEAKTFRWQDAVAGEVPLFPHVENFVHKAANDFTLGIVSMAKRQEIEHILERTSLAKCFSVIISSEDVELPKPDPQCYREGFRQIDLVRIAQGHLPMIHGECVVIEDTPPGVAAARAADLPVLGVTNTVPASELRQAGAEWIATDLNDWFPASIRRVFA
jgi:phosphoglycolate phosphatase/beta-phosphoglucomutase